MPILNNNMTATDTAGLEKPPAYPNCQKDMATLSRNKIKSAQNMMQKISVVAKKNDDAHMSSMSNRSFSGNQSSTASYNITTYCAHDYNSTIDDVPFQIARNLSCNL